jgi:hypothetical protein
MTDFYIRNIILPVLRHFISVAAGIFNSIEAPLVSVMVSMFSDGGVAIV